MNLGPSVPKLLQSTVYLALHFDFAVIFLALVCLGPSFNFSFSFHSNLIRFALNLCNIAPGGRFLHIAQKIIMAGGRRNSLAKAAGIFFEGAVINQKLLK